MPQCVCQPPVAVNLLRPERPKAHFGLSVFRPFELSRHQAVRDESSTAKSKKPSRSRHGSPQTHLTTQSMLPTHGRRQRSGLRSRSLGAVTCPNLANRHDIGTVPQILYFAAARANSAKDYRPVRIRTSGDLEPQPSSSVPSKSRYVSLKPAQGPAKPRRR